MVPRRLRLGGYRSRDLEYAQVASRSIRKRRFGFLNEAEVLKEKRILTQNVASARCSALPPTVHLRNAVGALNHRALSYVEVES